MIRADKREPFGMRLGHIRGCAAILVSLYNSTYAGASVTFAMPPHRQGKRLLTRQSVITAIGARVGKRRRAEVSSASYPTAPALKQELPHVKGSERPTTGVACENGIHSGWTDLCVSPDELRPSATLIIGQCFNWQQAAPDCWVGVLGCEVVAVRETPHTTLFRSLDARTKHEEGTKITRGAGTDGCASRADDASNANLGAALRNYFFLEERLTPLYREWSAADPRMAAVASCLAGVRVVRQDPVECIFSFICSSNNNIPRITLMLKNLRRTYGDLLLAVGEGGLKKTGMLEGSMECEDWASMPLELYSFPTIDALVARASEAELRAMGFGYRAKYIVESANRMEKCGGRDWAFALRSEERDAVRDQLIKLSGVGPKVADCIALFSLDQASAIPVDVHVWRIACRDYDPSLLECKSLTPTVYRRVGDLFRERFGSRAGWAHSLLFAAELPGFKERLPQAVQEEMEDFRLEERARKAETKDQKALAREEKAILTVVKPKPRRQGIVERSRGKGVRTTKR